MIRFRSTDIISLQDLVQRVLYFVPYLFWDIYLAVKAYKRSNNPNRRLAAVIIVSGCILVPLIQMAMIWEYGYTPRYAVDFAWQMIFGAFAVLFSLYGKIIQQNKRIIDKIFLIRQLRQ